MNNTIDIGFDDPFHIAFDTPVNATVDGNLLDNIAVTMDGNLLNNIGVTIPKIHLDAIDLNANVAIGTIVTDSTLKSDSNLNTDSKVDLNLKVAITELPKIKLEFGLDNMRIHLPTHYQFCFSLLGLEVFKFALCGESMVGIEPYVPHKTEKCG